MSAPTDLPPRIAPLFDYAPRTRVVFGPGTVESIGDHCRELGATRVLLVSDPGLKAAGSVDRCRQLIESSGMHVELFDDVQPNPTTEDVERGLSVARDAGIDLIVGFGGGSSMDAAKGINFLLTNGGKMEDYWGVGKAHSEMLPMIAVPTTAGTGSEAQSFALIANPRTHMKMACGDRKAACRLAILDPELTLTMPVSVAANTGIDAITHAVESFVTRRRNPVSAMFSLQAWRLLQSAFPRVFANPEDINARGDMLLGAHFAGAAIENSMLGAAHSLANPLSAHFGTTHGIAVGIMLPHVIRYNSRVVSPLYGELAHAAGLCDKSDEEASSKLSDFIRSLVAKSGCPTSLKECHVDPEMIPVLAKEATQQWTAQFNPRTASTSEFEELYRCAMES